MQKKFLENKFPKNNWYKKLNDEFQKEYFLELSTFLEEAYKKDTIYPLEDNIFNAFKMTDYDQVKVVILGQDPYHQPGQAHGLSFSVEENVKLPPSLKNIFKEIEADLGIKNQSGNLSSWAREGVLLLNSFLTVKESSPMAHSKSGWEKFTDSVLKVLNEKDTPVIFLLWGAPSQKKEILVTNPKHVILKSVHPSPLSAHRGFLGCKHFSKTNEILKKNNLSEINWGL